MSNANRFTQSRDLVFSRERLNAGDEYIDYVYSAKRLETRDRGITNNLRKGVGQHKNRIRGGFTDDYNCIRLGYWKSFDDVHSALGREKQLKRWRPRKEEVVDRTQEPAPARLGG